MKTACVLLVAMALVSCDKSSKEPTAEKKSAVQIAKEKRAALRAKADDREALASDLDPTSLPSLAAHTLFLHRKWMNAQREFHLLASEAEKRDKNQQPPSPEFEAVKKQSREAYQKYLDLQSQIGTLERETTQPNSASSYDRAFDDFSETASRLSSKLDEVERQDGIDSPAAKELRRAWTKMTDATLEDVITRNYWKPSSAPPTPALIALAEKCLALRKEWLITERDHLTWFVVNMEKGLQEGHALRISEIEINEQNSERAHQKCRDSEKEILDIEIKANSFSGAYAYYKAFGDFDVAMMDLMREWRSQKMRSESDIQTTGHYQATFEKMRDITLDDLIKGNYWKPARTQ